MRLTPAQAEISISIHHKGNADIDSAYISSLYVWSTWDSIVGESGSIVLSYAPRALYIAGISAEGEGLLAISAARRAWGNQNAAGRQPIRQGSAKAAYRHASGIIRFFCKGMPPIEALSREVASWSVSVVFQPCWPVSAASQRRRGARYSWKAPAKEVYMGVSEDRHGASPRRRLLYRSIISPRAHMKASCASK